MCDINVKCMYMDAPGHIIDCSELILGIYSDIVISYVHMNHFACVAYVAFEGQICCWHMYSNSMVIRSGNLLLFDSYMQQCGVYK